MKKLLTIIFSLMLMLVLLPISINSNEIKADGDDNPATPNYLTFTAQADNSSVTFKYKSGSAQYSTDDGANWNECPSTDGCSIDLDKDEKVQFKGTDVVTGSSLNDHFSMTGSIAASGDVTSLTNGTGGDATLTKGCYTYMFSFCASLTTAPNLPATTLAENCYSYMFYGCEGLTTAPNLPAETLASNCYQGMFFVCTALKVTTSKEGSSFKIFTCPDTGGLTDPVTNMFANTGGSFTGTPEAGTTYYVKGIAGDTFGGCDWYIDTDGTLTIKPSSAPEAGYNSGELRNDITTEAGWPWYNYNDSITKVVVETGVKSGNSLAYMFYDSTKGGGGYKNLTEINLSGLDFSNAENMSYILNFPCFL